MRNVGNCSEPRPLVVPATMRKPAGARAGAWDKRLAGASTLNRTGPITHLDSKVGSKVRVSGKDIGKELSVLLGNHTP
jgi:hypothetical protein